MANRAVSAVPPDGSPCEKISVASASRTFHSVRERRLRRIGFAASDSGLQRAIFGPAALRNPTAMGDAELDGNVERGAIGPRLSAGDELNDR